MIFDIQTHLWLKLVPRLFSSGNGINAHLLITLTQDGEVEGPSATPMITFVRIGVLDDGGICICAHLLICAFGIADGHNLVYF